MFPRLGVIQRHAGGGAVAITLLHPHDWQNIAVTRAIRPRYHLCH
jgi:hypothetical protein